MHKRSWLIGFFTFLLCFPTAWAKSAGKESKNIQQSCSAIDLDLKNNALSIRYFAALSPAQPNAWTEFHNEVDLQKACSKGFARKASAYFKAQVPVLIEFELKSPTKEWVNYLKCYYRVDGSLEKIHSDFRRFGAYQKGKGDEQQFLVKVIRDRYYDPRGKCIKKSSPRFFNTSTGGELKDVVFKDVAWPLYLSVEKLPFYQLLQASTTPTPSKL
ncbi:MAG TPA: hypothetical protein VJ873_03135 [bacterium]|nr:hypothetical protein [bacterium]